MLFRHMTANIPHAEFFLVYKRTGGGHNFIELGARKEPPYSSCLPFWQWVKGQASRLWS